MQDREAGIDVYASTGVVDGKGTFGYLMYVRPEDIERAHAALAASGVAS